MISTLWIPEPNSGCWLFLGYRDRLGYGHMRRAGRGWLAHRWVFVQVRGSIPDELVLDHKCRNSSCVNPDHLEPVTQAENIRRGLNTGRLAVAAFQRNKTQCPQGHPYSEDNTYRSGGRRICATCAYARVKARRSRQRDLSSRP